MLNNLKQNKNEFVKKLDMLMYNISLMHSMKMTVKLGNDREQSFEIHKHHINVIRKRVQKLRNMNNGKMLE